MMALDLIMLVIILLAPQDLCVEAQNKDGCRYVAYHVHTLNQHVAENKTCSDVNENKDQTSEIAALKRESNILKTELNVLKDLILRQMQTTAGNRSCIEAADRNDQTLEIAALRTESNLLKSELNVLKDLMLRQTRQHAVDIQVIEAKLQKEKEEKIELQQKVATLQANDEIKKVQIKSLNGSLSSKQSITPVVGFHAALSKVWSGSGKVPFDKIISNYGNGFNKIAHVFNVPTKGLYFLILSVMNSGNPPANSWLMRGSSRVALAYAVGGLSYNVGTVSTVLLLNAGEHVYAQHANGQLYSGSPYHYTYLAGFLIHRSDI